MNRLAIVALILVGIGCRVQADDLSACSEELKEAISEIAIPKAIKDARSSIHTTWLEFTISGQKYTPYVKDAIAARPAPNGNRFARDYYETLSTENRAKLVKKSVEFLNFAKLKLSALNCPKSILSTLVNLDESLDWPHPKSQSYVKTSLWFAGPIKKFNQYHKLALIYSQEAW